MAEDWLKRSQEVVDQNEEESGSGVPGIDPPLVKFQEGTSQFRILPAHAAVSAITAAINSGDWAAVKAAAEMEPLARAQVYMPGRGDDDAGGISLFNAARVSPYTVWPGEPNSVRESDPVERFLEDEGIRWVKTDDLDPRGRAIRAATKKSDRILFQVVNFGINATGFQRGQDGTNVLFWSYKDWTEKFSYPVLVAPHQQKLTPMDLFYGGMNFQIRRVGTRRDTQYQVQGVFPAAGNGWGYPAFMTGDQVDIQESLRVLSLVKPWPEVIKKATCEEIDEALRRMMKLIDAKFVNRGQVAIPGMPPAVAPAPQVPAAPPPVAQSPFPSGPNVPPAPPPMGQPSAPPMHSAPATPPNVPNLWSPAPAPAPPPAAPMTAPAPASPAPPPPPPAPPPAGPGVDQGRMDQAMANPAPAVPPPASNVPGAPPPPGSASFPPGAR